MSVTNNNTITGEQLPSEGTSNIAGNGSGQKPTFPWAAIGAGADALGTLLPQNTEYSGDKGNITAGINSATDGLSNSLMNIPPWGTIAGGILKASSFLSKGANALGLGTDGMTTTDAVLGSSLFGWNIGLINGIGSEKANTLSRDTQTWAQAGNSYGGSLIQFEDAMTKQGKKYGRFSKGALNKANTEINSAGRIQNRLKSIMTDVNMSNESLANQADMENMRYFQSISGGYDQSAIHSAKSGGIMFTQDQIRRARGVTFKNNFTSKPYIEFKTDLEEIEKFQKGGQMTVIPEGALHAHKHNLEKEREDLKGEITHKGIPVIDTDGNQQAEIERDEVILSLDLTQAVEELRKKFNESESSSEKDELALQAGKLIVEEFQTNLDDRTGLYKQIKA